MLPENSRRPLWRLWLKSISIFEEISVDYAFDHVHIICRDPDAMALYFKAVFGAEEIYREDNFNGALNSVIRLGSARFFLRGVRPGETPGPGTADSVMGLDHFSLAVDDVAAASAELKDRGAEFIRDPAPSGMGGRTTAFIRGPEDIRIELSERSGETYAG